MIALLSAIVCDHGSSALRPPLPTIVRQSLSRRRLAYLGTVDNANASSSSSTPCPHISLMRFTYLPEDDAILMSTNVYTKKYDMLSAGGGSEGGGALVALLVHDFADSSHTPSPSSSSSLSTSSKEMVGGKDGKGGGMYSITLNGTCTVVEDGTKSFFIRFRTWYWMFY